MHKTEYDYCRTRLQSIFLYETMRQNGEAWLYAAESNKDPQTDCLNEQNPASILCIIEHFIV